MSLLERISSHSTASGSGLLHHSRPSLVLQSVCGPVLRPRQCSRVLVHSSSRSDECTPSTSAPVAVEAAAQQRIEDHRVKTRYIAETLLPTRHGKFRLRGYKHSVRLNPAPVLCTGRDCLSEVAAVPLVPKADSKVLCCCSLMVASRLQNLLRS